MGQDMEGLLRLELKSLGLFQNSETWPKEDGGEPAQADVTLQMPSGPCCTEDPALGLEQSKRLQRGDGV